MLSEVRWDVGGEGRGEPDQHVDKWCGLATPLRQHQQHQTLRIQEMENWSAENYKLRQTKSCLDVSNVAQITTEPNLLKRLQTL